MNFKKLKKIFNDVFDDAASAARNAAGITYIVGQAVGEAIVNKVNPSFAFILCENDAKKVEAYLEKHPEAAIQPLDSTKGGLPLEMVAVHGFAASAEALLKFGADPSLENSRGYSPVALAAGRGSDAVLELFLKRDPAAASRQTSAGTPLFVAAEEGRPGAVKLLLKFGADPRVACNDADGQLVTPLEAAKDGLNSLGSIDYGDDGEMKRSFEEAVRTLQAAVAPKAKPPSP